MSSPMPASSSIKSPLGTSDETRAVLSKGTVLQKGIYRIIYGEIPQSKSWAPWKAIPASAREILEALPHVRRFLVDIYSIGPYILAACWAIDLLSSMYSGATLYLTRWLLETIEAGVSSGLMDVHSVRNALLLRVLLSVVYRFLTDQRTRLRPMVEQRTRDHFELLRLRASLAENFATTSSGASTKQATGEVDPFRILSDLTRFIKAVLELSNETWFLIHTARSNELGNAFLALWCFQLFPILDLVSSSPWNRGVIFFTDNKHYLKMKTIVQMITAQRHRQEILGGDLGQQFVEDYANARRWLGDTPSDRRIVYKSLGDPLWPITYLDSLFVDWPTLFYGVYALQGSVPFSFSSITSIKLATQSLPLKIQIVFGSQSLSRIIRKIKDLYINLEIQPDPTANAASYPDERKSSSTGMQLQLHNLTFGYPSSKSGLPAVRNVSCEIKPGMLVVIVGANGSGKTSLVKLLTRLYDPSSGAIIIDGEPATFWKLRDLRRATAVLSQDHTLFPLSIGDNIRLGQPGSNVTNDALNEAAIRGCADEFIKKQGDSYDTVLQPIRTKTCVGVEMGQPLYKVYEEIEKQTEISGGERQRLVAARTFLRIAMPSIKLVVVDEPSAAMDPAGEYTLLKHLREARAGKTMIFITHRFGHLVKHADLILCMKDGEIVEQGKHEELLARRGEYHELYNVQAQAFT